MRNVIGDFLERHLGDLAWVAALVIFAGAAAAQGTDRPRLHTNEAYVGEATQPPTLSVRDPMAVFAFVLGSLPDRVTVYPTENYYYFSFMHEGTPFAGNLRFDPRDRDQGKVQFGYFQALTEWKDEEGIEAFALLDASRGVQVERLERLVYRVSYGTKNVVFALNDLSHVKPPQTAIATDEKFLGPIFDESGIRFFFIYNARLKIFHYVLDETVKVPDEFFASARTDRIVIGRRTGFAFYRDHHLDRKVMVGAYAGNSRVNNYFDGPFDQLPENFIDGEALREAIIGADPSVKGKIDRLGNYTSEEGRYLIHPYLLYRQEADLQRFHTCATRNRSRPAYYRCFVAEGQGDPGAGRAAGPQK